MTIIISILINEHMTLYTEFGACSLNSKRVFYLRNECSIVKLLIHIVKKRIFGRIHMI